MLLGYAFTCDIEPLHIGKLYLLLYKQLICSRETLSDCKITIKWLKRMFLREYFNKNEDFLINFFAVPFKNLKFARTKLVIL